LKAKGKNRDAMSRSFGTSLPHVNNFEN